MPVWQLALWVQMGPIETKIAGSYRWIEPLCCSHCSLNECGKLLFPASLKHLAWLLIEDHQAHLRLSTSRVSEGLESHIDFLSSQAESHGEQHFDSKKSWHLAQQLKCGLREQWVPLISQLPPCIYFKKMERFCWKALFPGCSSALTFAAFGIMSDILWWGEKKQ